MQHTKMIIIYRCLLLAATGLLLGLSTIVSANNCTGVTKPPVPIVSVDSERFLEGENFTINCTANITRNTIAKLSWKLPSGLDIKDDVSIIEKTNAENVTEGEIYNALTIVNAKKKHQGIYSCESSNTCDLNESNKIKKIFLPEPILKIRIRNSLGITRQPTSSIALEIDAYPPLNKNLTILKDGKKLQITEPKYSLKFLPDSNDAVLKVSSLTVADYANYTFIANNGKLETSAHFLLEVGGDPVNFFSESETTCVKGNPVSFRCDVSGYPLPDITWKFTSENDTGFLATTSEQAHIYNKTAFLDLKKCDKTAYIACIAKTAKNVKRRKEVVKTRKLIVYEIEKGFGIVSKNAKEPKWFVETDFVSLKCLASKYDFSNVTWSIENDEYSRTTVKYPTSSDLSYVAELEINSITLEDSGNYTCIGIKENASEVYDSIDINVLRLQAPIVLDHEDTEEAVYRHLDMYLNCTVTGAPLPKVTWLKDGKSLNKNDSNVFLYENIYNLTTINATLKIERMQPENAGKYECVAKGTESTQRKSYTLSIKADVITEPKIKYYLLAIAVIILILVVLIVFLTIKVRKDKKFRKELQAAGLLYFKEGFVNSLNPDLGIDEQAELLPYDEKFEFPPEKLVYGKQLGAGAFGVVYKAEARGIINAEESTPVAVKMVKKTADNMYIKALASELKIMVHLGKHINIVNLLGACTKNVGKRELMVIVEYCKYGNIHNYMQRHREVFIDQLDTDNKEKMGKVNRAYTTTSSGSTGMHSDYFGSANTQDTDNTFLNTANTVRSSRKTSEGYVQPEWRSNYESDYSYDGRSPRPLTSRDLLAWAFQIARGMEYLASRKVLHGDLAARNILLADDNIVKICDFGLAKSIYKNDEYQKKENCPLPVKWLAIECMTDRIFSTQSDVWSFGIVLWELFTLAKTPYPNIHPASLLQFLTEGHRLDKPAYVDDRLYGVMKKCWEAKPTLRPTFTQLQELLGTFLEDNVRNHYVDLNSSYMDKNAKVGGQEDYLDMMCAPDYNNMVTPSPHHYVNTDNQKSFFPPTPVKVDDGGYLQMSPSNQGIFSPRVPDSEFDFDPRKFNPKASEAGSCGSELTPMLTLNNLPARSGSESDHEGNTPYLNVCTRIDEETDEVFIPSLNDTKNAKNIQQSAVTNPTYITFDNIDEKPKDIINNYVNMPNGLVK